MYKKINKNADVVQDWLSRAQYINDEIDSLKDALTNIRAKMSLSAVPIKERVQTSASNTFEDDYVKVAEYERKIIERINELGKICDEILGIINLVDDNRLRKILIQRYINFKSWKEIINAEYCSKTHIFRLHNEALDVIRKILVERKIIS